MTLRVFHLVFVCCSAWLLSACCRSETYYVDQEVKDFTVFPVGSWWVYVDSVSGQRDSVVMTGISQGVFDGPADPRCVDRFESYGIGYEYYWMDNNQQYVKYEPKDQFDLDSPFVLSGYIKATEKGTQFNPFPYDRNAGWLYCITYDTLLPDGTIRTVLASDPSFTSEVSYRFIRGIGLVVRFGPVRPRSKYAHYVLENYHIN